MICTVCDLCLGRVWVWLHRLAITAEITAEIYRKVDHCLCSHRPGIPVTKAGAALLLLRESRTGVQCAALASRHVVSHTANR